MVTLFHPIGALQLDSSLLFQLETAMRAVAADYRPAPCAVPYGLTGTGILPPTTVLMRQMGGVVADPAWLATFTADGRQLANLRPGWDGPGSIAISPKALYTAERITRHALEGLIEAVPPYIVPGGDGSVQIEWHERHGELELDIDRNGGMAIWGQDHRSGAEFEDEGVEALALFYRWAPRLAAISSDGLDATTSPASPPFEIAA